MTRRAFLTASATLAGSSMVAAQLPLKFPFPMMVLSEPGATVDLPPHIRQMLEAAILAPSGHNTQPWWFHIQENQIRIVPDLSRRLPVVDPQDRELWASLGCATENLVRKAQTLGYETTVDIQGLQDPTRPAFAIQLKPAPARQDPLVEAIPQRRTNRSIYTSQAIPADVLAKLAAVSELPPDVQVHFVTDPPVRAQLVALIQEGNRRQMANPAFTAELYSWMRVNRQQVQDRQDGLTYAALDFPALPRLLANWLVQGSLKPETQVKRDQAKLDSTAAFALITIREDTPTHWLAAGRQLQTLALQATHVGLAHAYCNQPIEVEELRPDLLAAVGVTDQIPFLLLRLGYAAPTPSSPRRPLTEVVRD